MCMYADFFRHRNRNFKMSLLHIRILWLNGGRFFFLLLFSCRACHFHSSTYLSLLLLGLMVQGSEAQRSYNSEKWNMRANDNNNCILYKYKQCTAKWFELRANEIRSVLFIIFVVHVSFFILWMFWFLFCVIVLLIFFCCLLCSRHPYNRYN